MKKDPVELFSSFWIFVYSVAVIILMTLGSRVHLLLCNAIEYFIGHFGTGKHLIRSVAGDVRRAAALVQ